MKSVLPMYSYFLPWSSDHEECLPFQFPKDEGFELTLEGCRVWKGRLEKEEFWVAEGKQNQEMLKDMKCPKQRSNGVGVRTRV